MPLRLNILLIMLVAGFSGAKAKEISIGNPATTWVTDSQNQPVYGSSGECWHSSLLTPSASLAAGCRAVGSQSASIPITERRASASQTPATSRASTADAAPISAGGSTQHTMTNNTSTPPYLTDSRGVIVRGSGNECWRTGSWTPDQATVVGCDGVLAKALPVPAPAEPAKSTAPPSAATKPLPVAPDTGTPVPPTAAPAERPSAVLPSSPSSPKESGVAPKRRTPPAVVPAAPPVTPPAAIAPQESLGETAPQEPASEKVTFDTDTFFDFDKSGLKPAGKRKLDILASRLANSTVEVAVAVGHTDAIGTQSYNQKLSERRASAVVNYLRQKGLPQEKIFFEGKGETQPQASNTSKAGRAKNRRVEVEVVGIRSKN